MKVAVLFDGAGLARLGLERAGLDCTGFEINKYAHWMSQRVGSGKSVLCDATTVDLSEFDAVWASPPCQLQSVARTTGAPTALGTDYLEWCLQLPHNVLWVENVVPSKPPYFGKIYNAAQFLETPIQNRNRIIGGRFPEPNVYHKYKRVFPNVSPAVLATEYKGYPGDTRRASRFKKRKLTLNECAELQGFRIPGEWYLPPFPMSSGKWEIEMYRAIGNGVPVYMARAFGEAVVLETL